MKYDKKTLIYTIIVAIIIVAIFLLIFPLVISRLENQIAACKCNELPMTPIEKIDKYCISKDLTREEIIEHSKNYQKGDTIKSKFVQDKISISAEEYFSCNNWFLRNDEKIVNCYCGK